jgi:glutathione S-transferase
MTYTVYGTRRSSNFTIEAALTIAGSDYDFVDVDLDANAQRKEAYARINPTRKIPAMRLPSGEIVTESAAILLTIADRYPQKKLLPPQASADRAQAYRWIAFFASEIYPMVEIVDYPERFTGKKGDLEATRDLARERVRDRFAIFERAIAGKPWTLAWGFTIADLYAANISRWSVGKEWREENCPKIQKLAAAVAARPDIAPIWEKHFGDGK